MAVDYLFVSQVFSFLIAFVLMLMAFSTESIWKVALHFLSGISFYLLAELLMMAYSATAEYVIPMHYLFYLFSVVNLFLMMVFGLMGLAAFRKSRRASKQDEMI